MHTLRGFLLYGIFRIYACTQYIRLSYRRMQRMNVYDPTLPRGAPRCLEVLAKLSHLPLLEIGTEGADAAPLVSRSTSRSPIRSTVQVSGLGTLGW
jgi:hypothetical protein